MLILGAIGLVFNSIVLTVIWAFADGSLGSFLVKEGTELSFNFLIGMASMVCIVLLLEALLLTAFYFAVPMVMFLDTAPVEALKSSIRACNKNLLPMLLFGLILFAATAAAIVTFGLGFLVLCPVMFSSWYCNYKDIYPLSAGNS